MYDNILAIHVHTPICQASLYGEGSHIPVKCHEPQRQEMQRKWSCLVLQVSDTPTRTSKRLIWRNSGRRDAKAVHWPFKCLSFKHCTIVHRKEGPDAMNLHIRSSRWLPVSDAHLNIFMNVDRMNIHS